jgi:peptidoglycan/LPS O-acetylase OafA/YrhL
MHTPKPSDGWLTLAPLHGQRVAALDALRGVAALWVLGYHFSLSQHMPALAQSLPWLGQSLAVGDLGVAIFFVLSGVVMATTTHRVAMTTGNAVQFLKRRLIRLTPPYYAALALGVALVALKVRMGEPPNVETGWRSVLSHVVYAQDFLHHANIIDVFWTLVIEVQFYAAFALLWCLADRRRVGGADAMPQPLRRERLAWALAALALPWPLGWVNTPVWNGGFLPFWYLFMGGVLCAFGLENKRATAAVPAYLYASVMIIHGALKPNGASLTGGLTIVFVLAMSHRPAIADVLKLRWLQWLGMVSYSLYLIHLPAMGPLMRLIRKGLGDGLTADAVGLVATCMACLVLAALMHRFLELPAIAWSRRVRYT